MARIQYVKKSRGIDRCSLDGCGLKRREHAIDELLRADGWFVLCEAPTH